MEAIRRWMLATVVALGTFVAGCSGSTPHGEATSDAGPGPETHAVAINGFAYRPNVLQIAVGDAVRWTNSDEVLHTVTLIDQTDSVQTFDGELPEAGTEFTFTFNQAGTYQYFCTRHTFMNGTVVVAEG